MRATPFATIRTFLLVLFIISAAGLITCALPPTGDKKIPAQRKAGALDCILLCEQSPDMGQIVFPHYKHMGPRSEGNNGIACGVCHRAVCMTDAKRPYKPCRSCHPPESAAFEDETPKLPYL